MLTIGSIAMVIPAYKPYSASLRPEIRNIRLHVKLLADSVSDIASDNGEAVLLNIGLNRVTYIAEHGFLASPRRCPSRSSLSLRQ